MKISYGITVHNESDELDRLLNILTLNIDEQDEIIICVDGDDKGVFDVINDYDKPIHYNRKLEGNFADHKN